MKHARGPARAAAGMQQKERIVGIHGHAWKIGVQGEVLEKILPPDIAAAHHLHAVVASVDHNHFLHAGALAENAVQIGLERFWLAASHHDIRGNHNPRAGIVDSVLHAAFRIAGEDIGMHRAKAGAGQHGDDKFGNHGQVKGHAVALANAQSVQGGGHAADVVVEHLVGVGPDFHFPFALPDERGLVAVVGYDVPVNTVIGGIEPRAPEPFHARHGKIAVVDLFPGP